MAEEKSLERWIWDAACSIRGAQDAPKYKNFILPLVFAKRLCDVFDDELDRIAQKVGSRKKAFTLVEHVKVCRLLHTVEWPLFRRVGRGETVAFPRYFRCTPRRLLSPPL